MYTPYQKLVLESINTFYLELDEDSSDEDKLKALYNCFCEEYWWGAYRLLKREEAFENWIQGLPTALLYMPTYYTEVEKWGEDNKEDTTDYYNKISTAFFEMYDRL